MLAEILEQLGTIKQQGAEVYKAYKVLKDKEDSLKNDLLTVLKSTGLKSAKGDAFTASIAETPTIVIKDEAAAMEWLKNSPNVESDFYIGIKKIEFNGLAKQMLKETGELADGTDVEIRESLSIRANKKG